MLSPQLYMINLIMKSFIIDFVTSSIFFEIFVLSHLILENDEYQDSFWSKEEILMTHNIYRGGHKAATMIGTISRDDFVCNKRVLY